MAKYFFLNICCTATFNIYWYSFTISLETNIKSVDGANVCPNKLPKHKLQGKIEKTQDEAPSH